MFWLAVVIDVVRRGCQLLRRRALPFLRRRARALWRTAVAAWSWGAPRVAAGSRRLARATGATLWRA
ncbi:MAG: hypothetical protein M3P53_00700, partial [Actinomycetota bacterium]|nr:hypothetical protein [Actinomycetota bacterium]